MSIATHSTSPAAHATAPRHDDGEAPLWRKALPVLLILVLMGLVGYGLSTLMGSGGSSGPKRQTVKIAVLPDTPPPPPPPKEEKKPEPPKEEPKQMMQMDQPKVADNPPPQPAEQLKMEGAAGDGPSAFSSGSVTQDYVGQAIGTGGAQPKVVDRTKFKYYANSARQMLRTELDKTLPPELLNLGARLRIWVDERGAISRYEVAGLTDKAAEEKLRQAMDAVSRNYRLVPPADMPQPLELRLSVNPLNG